MKINKNASSIIWKTLIGIIIIAIPLLFLTNIHTDLLDYSKYYTGLNQCNTFTKTITLNEDIYFDKDRRATSRLLKDYSNICVSKNVEIENKNINRAADLISNCWYGNGAGEDIIISRGYQESICVYCGLINAKEDISSFDNKLIDLFKKDKDYKHLFSASNTKNLNNLTLITKANFPENLKQGESLIVYYFIHKPELEIEVSNSQIFDKIEDGLEILADTSVSEFFLGDYSQTVSAVSVEKHSNKIDFNANEEIIFDSKNLNVKCSSFIIPNNYYN